MTSTALFTGAAALPAAVWMTTLVLEGISPLAAASAPRLLSIVASDAFVLEACVLTIAAPLSGAAAMHGAPHARAVVRRIALALACFGGASLALGGLASAAGALDPWLLVRSRATLVIVGAALAAFGMACATLVRDPLDGSALAILLTAVVAGGLFAVGPVAAGLSEGAMNAGLLVSPPIAITSAAGIDLLRTELLYQLTPIAHRRFTYPGWGEGLLVYGLIACLSATAAVTLHHHTSRKVHRP